MLRVARVAQTVQQCGLSSLVEVAEQPFIRRRACQVESDQLFEQGAEVLAVRRGAFSGTARHSGELFLPPRHNLVPLWHFPVEKTNNVPAHLQWSTLCG